ncbi:hypothetical protein [Azohydromonas caseinilytica]|uniref:Uncharacterized protein n=1 Tax=Azohydromonas caseinilytica TaxID=2728836 RepID=A0A848FL13_9BURK|nr:hypothetical protein [Azohydromonas caseinilytica]NML18923.1 hypothetical protein [Azohydromonas caseinilytica]
MARHKSERGAVAWWVLGAVAVLALLAWWGRDAGSGPAQAAAPEAVKPAASAAAATTASAPASAPRAPFTPAALAARQRERAMWQQRLEQAQQTLEAYRASTRYPHEARPLAEQPDQVRPNLPIEEDAPLRLADGRAARGVHLRTSQERVFVQGDESVRLSLSLRGDDGAVLPLRVVRATAREVPPPNTGSLYPVVPVNFNDEGLDGDLQARDGVQGVRLQPERQGFAGLSGQLRVEVVLQHAGQEAVVFFDMVLTGAPGAVWTGSVREALEEGSLNFYLGAEVRVPGRYVVTGRVDDATGRPLALLSFNDEVGAGAQEFRLSLFGKLVRDAQPVFPLTLRDVEAFLLRPDSFPDRSLMARRTGTVLVTRHHPLAAFSPAEWQSEERSRYLAELQRDVSEAQGRLTQLGPSR